MNSTPFRSIIGRLDRYLRCWAVLLTSKLIALCLRPTILDWRGSMSNYLICKKVAQTILIVLIFANSVSSGAAQSRGEDNSMIDRVSGVKKSTFRILVNGQPSGTGFAVSRDGLILTSFHVVQLIQQAPNNQVQISIAPQIEVQTEDGTKYAATVHPSCQNAGLQDAIS